MSRCEACHRKVPLADAIAFACVGCKHVVCLKCKATHACRELDQHERLKTEQWKQKTMDSKCVHAKLEVD
jgi:hypothetical protein